MFNIARTEQEPAAALTRLGVERPVLRANLLLGMQVWRTDDLGQYRI